MGLRHLSGDVRRMLGSITALDQDNYPETLGKTLIINAPSVFKMVWGIVKPMLDLRTQAKIEVCPSNYLPTLARWVDMDSIPEYLGGTSKGSLIDDVGPWNDPRIVAEIDAELAAAAAGRPSSGELSADGGSPLPSPLPSPFDGLPQGLPEPPPAGVQGGRCARSRGPESWPAMPALLVQSCVCECVRAL